MEPGLDTIELRARKWMKLEGSKIFLIAGY